MTTNKKYNSKTSRCSQKPFFLETVIMTINDFSMLEKQNKILIAVSGGADSISLVLSLLALKDQYKIKIGIAHINHLLREKESLRDEAFVEKFASKLNLPFFCKQIDVKTHAKKYGLSIEQAGREVRYDFFKYIAHDHGYAKIATGHNKNDNAELVLINLLRGSGPKGLSGIPPVRNGLYIRPLIRITKEQILDFLSSINQEYMFDSSNNDMAYLRNQVRCKLLPHLEAEFNPEIIDALDRLSNILKSEEDYLEKKTQHAYKICLFKTDDSSVSLLITKISDLHPALLNRVLRKAIKSVKDNLNRITLGHINDIINLSLNTTSGLSLDLPGQIRVYKDKNTIVFKQEARPLREIGKQEKLALRQDIITRVPHSKH